MNTDLFELRNSLSFNVVVGFVFATIATFLALNGGIGPILGSLFCVLFSILMWARALDRRVQVTISSDGIIDRRNGYGIIPWREISQVVLKRTRSGWVLILDIRNPEFIARVARPSARWVSSKIGIRAFSRVWIFIDPSQVSQELRVFLQNAAHANQ